MGHLGVSGGIGAAPSVNELADLVEAFGGVLVLMGRDEGEGVAEADVEAGEGQLGRYLIQMRCGGVWGGAHASANEGLVRSERGTLQRLRDDEALLTREPGREGDDPGEEGEHLDEDRRFLHRLAPPYEM